MVRRVLLIGANGHLGTAVASRMHGRTEYEPILATGPNAVDDTYACRVDVRDADSVEALLDAVHPHSVVLLAGISGAACEVDPYLASEVNERGAKNVAIACARFGVSRLVYPSTSAVYGDDYSSPIAESGVLSPQTTYAMTKLGAEREIASATTGTLTAAILRIFNVYGRGMEQSLVERLRQGGAAPVELVGWHRFVRDYSHVDDVADAIVRSIDAPLPDPVTTLNIGTGRPISNAELVAIISRRHHVAYEVVGDTASYSCADPTAARRILGIALTPLSELLDPA